MPSRDIFTRNNIEKAAEAIRREQRRDDQSDTRVRRRMLQVGLDEEDSQLRSALEDVASQQRDWDGDYIDPDDLTDAELRQYANPSEFTNEIPFRGYRVDPDYESYVGYRLATQNPEALELMREQRGDVNSPEKRMAQNRLFEDIRAGRVNRSDLQWISELPGGSELLSENTGIADAYEVADFIEQERTNNPDFRFDIDLDEEIEGRLDQASRFVTRPLRAAVNVDLAGQSLTRNVNTARRAVEQSGGLQSENLRSRINRLEAEGLRQLEPLTLEGAEQNARRLREITEDLRRIQNEAELRPTANPAPGGTADQRAAIRSQVLPQVEAALGERGTYQAVNAVLRDQDAEQNRIALQQRLDRQALTRPTRFRDDRAWLSDQIENLDLDSRQPMSPRLLDNLETSSQGVTQSTLPGLWELVEIARQDTIERQGREGIQEINRLLDEYPEVRRVFDASPKSDTRSRLRGGESSRPYRQYMDFVQRYASPEARASAYNAVLKQYPVDTRNQIAGQLRRVEADYTSGDTALQRAAVDQLSALGGDLPESEAISPRRPVIGGDRYVTWEEIQQNPELKALVDRIDTRAKQFNDAMSQVEPRALRQAFPDQTSLGGTRFPKLAVELDPSTGRVIDSDIGMPDAYSVEVMGASRGGPPALQTSENLLGDADRKNTRISTNVLRFFADNPVLRQSSVSFKTDVPGGEGPGYQAQGALPKAVSDVFTSFIQREALRDTKPGTVVANQPATSGDLLESRLAEGETEATSSTVRRLLPFRKEGQTLPNLRGVAYQSAGFGPTDVQGNQYTFISPEGEAIPMQIEPSEVGLQGKVRVDPDGASVSQGALPASSSRYFMSMAPGLDAFYDQDIFGRNVGVEAVKELGRGVYKHRAALLPGAADLIPSPEAVRRGYQEGPQALAEQVATDFVYGLPYSVPIAMALATPALAPIAPAVGLAAITRAGGAAANEVIRQETGEGFVPKLRQFLGTEERTGIADRGRVREERPFVQPQIVANTEQRNPLLQSIQNRIGLARERFNPAKGEFGLSELLFDR